MERFEVSSCELLILQTLWEDNEDKTLQQVLHRTNERFQKTWKIQTVSTYLRRLIDKGYLEYYRAGRQYYYRPAVKKEAYFEEEVICNARIWDAAPSQYMEVWKKAGLLSEEEKEKLREILR